MKRQRARQGKSDAGGVVTGIGVSRGRRRQVFAVITL